MLGIIFLFFFTFITTLLLSIPILYILRKDKIYSNEVKEGKEVFNSIREKKGVKNTPRMGGFMIFFPILIIMTLIGTFSTDPMILVFVLTLSALFLIGVYDDMRDIGRIKGNLITSFRHRMFFVFLVTAISCFVISSIFFTSSIGLIGGLDINLGILLFTLFGALWFLSWYTTGIIDGVDGLTASVFIAAFFGMLIISFLYGNLFAILISTMMIAILTAFLYLNTSPARVYMTECGSILVTYSFAFVGFINSINGGYALVSSVVIGMVLVLTSLSVIVQYISKKTRGKKIFLSTPIHHHFQAKGIPSASIVTYYTLTTLILSLIGIALVFV